MPVLQHERTASTSKRIAKRVVSPTPPAISFEQSIAHLKQAFQACLGQRTGAIKPVIADDSPELFELANSGYFEFERKISHAGHLLAATGWQWYCKLELISKLAVAMRKYAISQSLNPDDEVLRARWTESLSIPFLAECLSRTAGYKRPSEVWVTGMVMLALGFADACRSIERKPWRSVSAISHLDAREAVLSLANLEKLIREIELEKNFSTSRVARGDCETSPWPHVAAACFLEVAARRNFWVAEIAVEVHRTQLSEAMHRVLAQRSTVIADVSSQMASISWQAALAKCWRETR